MSDRLNESESGSLTRREFTLEAALAILAGCVITVAEGCGSKSTPNTPTPPPADVQANIAGNHTQPHTGVITGAQITAGSGFALDIRGQATHPHTVDITAGDLTNLKNRQAVSKTSSTDNGHSHGVTFTPA
jgi:hypothetical protein